MHIYYICMCSQWPLVKWYFLVFPMGQGLLLNIFMFLLPSICVYSFAKMDLHACLSLFPICYVKSVWALKIEIWDQRENLFYFHKSWNCHVAVDTTYIHYSNAKSFEKNMCAILRSIPLFNVIFGHIHLCIHVNNQAFNCIRINFEYRIHFSHMYARYY